MKLDVDLPPEALQQLEDRIVARLVRAQSGEPYVDAKKAAEYLDCSIHALYRGVKARRIPFHRDGSRYIFRLTELDKAVEVNGNGALGSRRLKERK